MAFHEVPVAIALGASGGPERRTGIVALGSGHEERNARLAALVTRAVDRGMRNL